MRRVWINREQITLAVLAAPVIVTRRVWSSRPWRELTPEEKLEQAERKRRQAMAKLLSQEANLYWDRLQSCLDRFGYQHRPSKESANGGMRITQHVRFDRVVLQPEAIYFRINTLHLPFGTRIYDLMQPELLTDLSIACQRRVTAEYSDRIGAWFIVERAIGVRGIPDHVKFQDLLDGMPASADGLTIPIGTSVNAKQIYRSLGRMYSMLVAGTIGGGKSNYLNVMLATLIRRNSPERLKIILVDLKGGLEFQFYEGLPHLIHIKDHAPNGIADRNDQVPGILEWLHSEGERRQKILREAGYKNLGRYNAYQKKRRLPHVLLVIDEWADVMYDKDIKNRCEEILANVAQRFRAVGIHGVVCTQIPKAEVISTRIKGVLPAKICFSVPTNPASMVVLDNGDAKGLNPAGRCILQWEQQLEVQTPYINEDAIDAIVRQAIAGKFDEAQTGHDVTQLELLEWTLANQNGYLSRDILYRQFGKRGLKQEELEGWLKEFDNQEFVIGTALYRVMPAAGSRPRRLIAIDEDADDIQDNPPDDSNQSN